MDLLDFVNLKVFGNCAFRRQQREIIETVLKVRADLSTYLHSLRMHACGWCTATISTQEGKATEDTPS